MGRRMGNKHWLCCNFESLRVLKYYTLVGKSIQSVLRSYSFNKSLCMVFSASVADDVCSYLI